MWPILAGLALGGLQAAEQRKQAEADRQIRAEEIRNSPWTGMQSFTQVKNPSTFMPLLQGGLAGASMAQSMGGGSAATPAAAEAAPAVAPAAATSVAAKDLPLTGGSLTYGSPAPAAPAPQMTMAPAKNPLMGNMFQPPQMMTSMNQSPWLDMPSFYTPRPMYTAGN